MRDDDSKFSMWVVLAAIACCGLPLLLLAGGGSVFALGASFLTKSVFLLGLGLILALIFVWLFLRKRKP
ncbi:hypothetical protein HZA75_04660 [Candidatus Roizmanbacteria bacterium]|nr:hypothetical protein [Candidatus Roizmanbacteria bacterium]